MKLFLAFLLPTIFFTVGARADTVDSLDQPMHYILEPKLGYHFGLSELSGTNAVSHGPALGMGFRFERNHYFFTPDASFGVLLGLDRTVSVWSLGATLGGRLAFPEIDLYGGVAYRNLVGYGIPGNAFARLGAAFTLEQSSMQIWLEAMYGQYSATFLTKAVTYPYIGFEGGVRWPFEL